MAWFEFVWSWESGGNVSHIEEHGLTPDDFEFVFLNYDLRQSATHLADP